MALTQEELILLEMLPLEAYLQRIIDRFRSGEATAEEWREMAHAVLRMSESRDRTNVETIDRAILRAWQEPPHA